MRVGGLLETYVSVVNSGAVLGRKGEHRRMMAIKNVGRDRYKRKLTAVTHHEQGGYALKNLSAL
jgi:hypothetical protein